MNEATATREKIMDEAIQKKILVYIRYLDHVLFKNTPKPIENAAERETIGWLAHENDELICLEMTEQEMNYPTQADQAAA
jgi:hypothetical protein